MRITLFTLLTVLIIALHANATPLSHQFPTLGKGVTYKTELISLTDLSMLPSEPTITKSLVETTLDPLASELWTKEENRLLYYYINLFEDISYSYRKTVDIINLGGGSFTLDLTPETTSYESTGGDMQQSEALKISESIKIDTIMFFIPLIIVGGLIFGFYQVRGSIFFICFWIIFWYPIKDLISFLTTAF